jgi:hypothetical protein
VSRRKQLYTSTTYGQSTYGGKITSTSIAALVLGVSMSELMAKEHQKHEGVRGGWGELWGGKKLQARSPGSFFAAIINFQCD